MESTEDFNSRVAAEIEELVMAKFASSGITEGALIDILTDLTESLVEEFDEADRP